MPKKMQNLIEQYISSVQKIYGSHLKQVILYGSYARGDFSDKSDIDIMLLVDLPDSRLDEFSDNLSELGFDYNVEYGLWFMPIVKNIEHFYYWAKTYPFYLNVVKEGVFLYESA